MVGRFGLDEAGGDGNNLMAAPAVKAGDRSCTYGKNCLVSIMRLLICADDRSKGNVQFCDPGEGVLDTGFFEPQFFFIRHVQKVTPAARTKGGAGGLYSVGRRGEDGLDLCPCHVFCLA